MKRFLSLVVLVISSSLSTYSAPWKFLVYGDSRGTSAANQVNTTILAELAQATVAENPAFVLVPGDLVNSGTLAAFQLWTNTMRPVYQAGIEVYPIIGNHDDDDVAAFKTVFGSSLPNNGPTGEVDRTYAVAYSNVLVLGLDEYVNVGRVNQAWVNSVLNTNSRPHVFAMGHMPAFKADHADCLDDYTANRDLFWNSLSNVSCRAYFAGHDHFYNHCRLDDGDGNANNDVHQFIVGTAGAPLYSSYSYNGDNSGWTPRNVFHQMTNGYVSVVVDGNNVSMTWYRRAGPGVYNASGDVFTYTRPSPAALVWHGKGGNSFWSAAANWNPYAPPGEGIAMTFSGVARQSCTNDTALTSIGSVQFNNGGFSVAGNAIKLNGGMVNMGNNAWKIDSTLGAQSVFSNSAGTLTISGSLNQSAYLLTIAGAGETVLSGAINGAGDLAKTGAGALVLNGTVAAQSGAVRINEGALRGNGKTWKSVQVGTNGVLAPGVAGSIGMLAVSNSLTLAGTTVIELNKTGGVLTNDSVIGVTTLSLGGNLQVSASGMALADGDTFKLFDAASFTNYFASTTLPVLAEGLAWDVSALASTGLIRVSKVQFSATAHLDNGVFRVAVTGPTNRLFQIFAATAIPTTNWVLVSSGVFGTNGASIEFQDFDATNYPQRFYRMVLP